MVDKKFLNTNGVTYLATLLNNYPNNELLSIVINAISESLDEKVDKSSIVQSLSTGTEIGSINGITLYAPTSGGNVTITDTLSSGVLIATINGQAIYAPTYTNGDTINY